MCVTVAYVCIRVHVYTKMIQVYIVYTTPTPSNKPMNIKNGGPVCTTHLGVVRETRHDVR